VKVLEENLELVRMQVDALDFTKAQALVSFPHLADLAVATVLVFDDFKVAHALEQFDCLALELFLDLSVCPSVERTTTLNDLFSCL
jgi:hypothetical protein